MAVLVKDTIELARENKVTMQHITYPTYFFLIFLFSHSVGRFPLAESLDRLKLCTWLSDKHINLQLHFCCSRYHANAEINVSREIEGQSYFCRESKRYYEYRYEEKRIVFIIVRRYRASPMGNWATK